MKRAAAVILSLMFLGLQVMSAAPILSATTQTSQCCGCKKHACCVTEKNPDAQPLPAAPVAVSPQHELSLIPLSAVAWTIPVKENSVISSVDCLSSFATNVPLFARHCSFLV
jgi:hypothetical protein